MNEIIILKLSHLPLIEFRSFVLFFPHLANDLSGVKACVKNRGRTERKRDREDVCVCERERERERERVREK